MLRLLEHLEYKNRQAGPQRETFLEELDLSLVELHYGKPIYQDDNTWLFQKDTSEQDWTETLQATRIPVWEPKVLLDFGKKTPAQRIQFNKDHS